MWIKNSPILYLKGIQQLVALHDESLCKITVNCIKSDFYGISSNVYGFFCELNLPGTDNTSVYGFITVYHSTIVEQLFTTKNYTLSFKLKKNLEPLTIERKQVKSMSYCDRLNFMFIEMRDKIDKLNIKYIPVNFILNSYAVISAAIYYISAPDVVSMVNFESIIAGTQIKFSVKKDGVAVKKDGVAVKEDSVAVKEDDGVAMGLPLIDNNGELVAICTTKAKYSKKYSNKDSTTYKQYATLMNFILQAIRRHRYIISENPPDDPETRISNIYFDFPRMIENLNLNLTPESGKDKPTFYRFTDQPESSNKEILCVGGTHYGFYWCYLDKDKICFEKGKPLENWKPLSVSIFLKSDKKDVELKPLSLTDKAKYAIQMLVRLGYKYLDKCQLNNFRIDNLILNEEDEGIIKKKNEIIKRQLSFKKKTDEYRDLKPIPRINLILHEVKISGTDAVLWFNHNCSTIFVYSKEQKTHSFKMYHFQEGVTTDGVTTDGVTTDGGDVYKDLQLLRSENDRLSSLLNYIDEIEKCEYLLIGTNSGNMIMSKKNLNAESSFTIYKNEKLSAFKIAAFAHLNKIVIFATLSKVYYLSFKDELLNFNKVELLNIEKPPEIKNMVLMGNKLFILFFNPVIVEVYNFDESIENKLIYLLDGSANLLDAGSEYTLLELQDYINTGTRFYFTDDNQKYLFIGEHHNNNIVKFDNTANKTESIHRFFGQTLDIRFQRNCIQEKLYLILLLKGLHCVSIINLSDHQRCL